jgi:hypothetical protein
VSAAVEPGVHQRQQLGTQEVAGSSAWLRGHGCAQVFDHLGGYGHTHVGGDQ